MVAWAWLSFACIVGPAAAHEGVHPAVVEQTDWQRSLVKHVAAAAQNQSSKASARLLARLASEDVRAQLMTCSPEAAKLTPAALAERLRAEAAVAEVVSGFSSVAYGPSMSLPEGLRGPDFFENAWQVGVRHHFNWSKGIWWYATQDAVETELYGLRPFQIVGEPRSMEEAKERAPYCLLNLHRVDAGSPLYGDISAVFSPRVASASSVISAVDTGGWTAMCNRSSLLEHQIDGRWWGPKGMKPPLDPQRWPPAGYNPNCSAYRKFTDLGSLQHFDHLFLANEEYWNASLGRVACRLLAPSEKAPIIGADLVHYWEVLPAAQLTYPSAVKFIVAAFPSLFGTGRGLRLQKWCQQQGWVLIWSLGLNTGDAEANFWTAVDLNISIASNQRLADPQVLSNTTAALNLTLPENATASFREHWAKVAHQRRAADDKNRTISKEEWAQSWTLLDRELPSLMRLAALRAHSCADVEGCIGTTPKGDCFCYQRASDIEGTIVI